MKWIAAAVALAGCGRLSFEQSPDALVDDVALGDARIPTGARFVWIGGTNKANQFGLYGIKTIPDTANIPGGRDNGAAWVAPNNNLYLIGGHAFPEVGNDDKSNDLWRYDLATKEWAWVSGEKTSAQGGVYETPLVPSGTTQPGGRNDASAWKSGNDLYLFGGSGFDGSTQFGELSDVWRWDIVAKQWTWLDGASVRDAPGAYDGSDPRPGGRSASFAWQTDTHGFIYGGNGWGNVAVGKLADLWRYDFAGNTWDLVAGNGAVDVAPTYGVLGGPGSPGSRDGGCSWSDGSGVAWIYGGANAAGILGDMWRYDGGTWTWIHGSQSRDVAPTYGVQGLPDAGNSPGARAAVNCWRDNLGNLWLFGGFGVTSALADLWIYSPEANVWTWIGGTKTPGAVGVYGQKDVFAPENHPGARSQGSTWLDPNDGSLLLFGGDFGVDEGGTIGALDDLWRIVPE